MVLSGTQIAVIGGSDRTVELSWLDLSNRRDPRLRPSLCATTGWGDADADMGMGSSRTGLFGEVVFAVGIFIFPSSPATSQLLCILQSKRSPHDGPAVNIRTK